jgi:cytochrome c oxidase assembly protein subunit 11
MMTDNTKTVTRLLCTAVFMFAFGFLLVPLYDVLCAVTGFNGKTAGQYVPEKTTEIDKDRWVTVQFITNNNAGMPFGSTQR